MTIDITPEAVERIASNSTMTPPYVVATLRALSAALTASQAETAAAYEVAKPYLDLVEKLTNAVWHLMDNSETSGPIEDPTITVWRPDFDNVSEILDNIEGLASGSFEHQTAGELLANNIRALTPADSKAALDRMIAEAEERGMRKAAALCVLVKDEACQFSLPQFSMGASKCRADILAAIPKGKDHE